VIDAKIDSGKILLIENDEFDAVSFSELLEERGYTVTRASTGRDALAKARERRYDIIILDITLPDMKGKDVCSALKKSYKKIPVIVLTAQDDIDDIQELFEKGADDYIIKPCRQGFLLSSIQAYISRKNL